MLKYIIGVVVILLALFGAYVLFSDSDSTNVGINASKNSGGVGVDINIEEVENNASSGNVVTFVLTGENFKFAKDGVDNPNLVVKKGDKVKIEFSSVGGFHDFVIDEFNAKSERVSDGSSTKIEFVADKIGTYEYYCSVGSHRAEGMKGKFIVE